MRWLILTVLAMAMASTLTLSGCNADKGSDVLLP